MIPGATAEALAALPADTRLELLELLYALRSSDPPTPGQTIANTSRGTPYVVPTDHPLEYPAHSQQLAAAIDTHEAEWVSAVGASITLNSTDQQVASIAAANGGNSSNRSRLAICSYMMHVTSGTANNNATMTLAIRNAGNTASVAEATYAIALPTASLGVSGLAILPFIMAANTQYFIRVMAKVSGGTASHVSLNTLNVLHKILLP